MIAYYNKYKKNNNYIKIERKVGMEYKGSKDSNKGQGSSLLLFVLGLSLFIYQALEINFE